MSPGQRSSVAEVGRTAKLPSSLSWFFSPGFFSSTSPLRPAQPHLDPSSMLRDLIFLRIPPASVLCFANALYSKTLAKSHIDRQKQPFKKKTYLFAILNLFDLLIINSIRRLLRMFPEYRYKIRAYWWHLEPDRNLIMWFFSFSKFFLHMEYSLLNLQFKQINCGKWQQLCNSSP